MVRMATAWDRTSEFLGDNLAALLPVALITIFVPNSIEQNLAAAATTSGPELKAVLSVATVALAGLALWGKLAITAMVLERGAESPAATASRRMLPTIGVLLLLGLILLVLLVPPLVVLVSYGVDLTTLSSVGQASVPDAAKTPFGIAMLVVLPIALWVIARTYVLLVPVVVAERHGARAIPRAFALSRRLFWRILGVLILYAIVAGVAELAARAVFGTIFELVVGGEGPLSLAKILTSIVSGAVACGFTVLAAVFCAKLYLATTGQDELTLT